ncbi:MAG: 16S rRNA (guanine(527)-N(7))-methyltransferase RsmG [Dehalococcoidia bacterium]
MLPALFPTFADPGRWLPLLRHHADLVAEAAPRVKVTTVPADELVRRQYAESLELLRLMREAADFDRVADVGSGGGWPGLVIAAVDPGLRVDLIEPRKKRATLLLSMAEALGLANVHVHAVRAEEAGRGDLRDAASAVTARAVAPLPTLLEYVAPLVRPGGLVALPRGSSAASDVDAAAPSARILGLTFDGLRPMRPAVSHTAIVALYTKVAPTPERYPRRPGIPEKRPLECRQGD